MNTPTVDQPTCVICDSRHRTTPISSGHACHQCLTRIADNLDRIPKLAQLASASLAPASTGTSTGGHHLGPRYPLNLDAVDPALAHVPGHDVPLLVILEEWERFIRETRQLAPYGPASRARAAANGGTPTSLYDATTLTLIGVCAFLRSHMDWVATTPSFPIADYADEIAQCTRVLRRWDTTDKQTGTMVTCPTLTDNDTCGYRLVYENVHDDITCPRCRTTRSAMTLAAVAMADGREIWLDPEAASNWLGVSQQTLRRWAQQGRLRREHGRYLVKDKLGA